MKKPLQVAGTCLVGFALLCLAVYDVCTHYRNKQLLRAAKEGNTERVCKYLSAKNKDIEDDNGACLLTLAVCSKNVGAANAIIDARPQIDKTDDAGFTPLMYALLANTQEVEMVGLLIMNNACVNHKDFTGETPLMYAARKGHLKSAQILISAGAVINAQNNAGETPLMIAVKGTNAGMVRLLMTNGANVEIRDKRGRTPTEVAASINSPEIRQVINAERRPAK